MGFPRSLSIFMPLLFLLSQLHLIFTLSFPVMQPLCHHDESSALLQFKESLILDEYAYWVAFALGQSSACQKVASWKAEGNKSDCSSWNGVECDEDIGHVIGLDLGGSCLKGSINSSNSLFRLIHLQRLNLAYNDFNYSQIPSQVRDFSRLTHLNLSSSHFSGQIPLEISQLSHLSSLDLSDNNLELKKHSFVVPNILANLSSLTFLSLRDCGLYGEFSMGIFKLSNLRFVSVGDNEGLTGYLLDFTWSSLLETLDLTFTNFSGELPASMGNLGFLTELLISLCNFSGSIPSSLGNLTKLTSLYLSYNNFVGNIPPPHGKLVQLSTLSISFTQLTGSVAFKLVNLPQLSYVDLGNNLLSGEMHFGFMNETRLEALDLSENRLIGPVTFGLMNFTQLRSLDLSANNLHGQISNSIFNFKNFESLDLSENYLNGIVEFDELVKLKTFNYIGYFW